MFYISCNLSNNFSKNIEYMNPLVKTWKINAKAFVDLKRENYILSPSNPNEKYQYGNFVSFSKNGSFHGFYSAPCGNDCFTSINGTYKLIGKNKISIFIKEIERSGFCAEKSMVINKQVGYFEIDLISIDKIILKRQSV